MPRIIITFCIWLIAGLALARVACWAADPGQTLAPLVTSFASAPVDVITLYPGDSRSIEFEYA